MNARPLAEQVKIDKLLCMLKIIVKLYKQEIAVMKKGMDFTNPNLHQLSNIIKKVVKDIDKSNRQWQNGK